MGKDLGPNAAFPFPGYFLFATPAGNTHWVVAIGQTLFKAYFAGVKRLNSQKSMVSQVIISS